MSSSSVPLSGSVVPPLSSLAGERPPPAEPRQKLLLGLALVAVYLIWSSTYLALRFAVLALPAMLVVTTRFIVAGTVLIGVLKLRGQPGPTGRQLVASIPGGVLLFVIGNGLVALAEREVSSGAGALVCATMPLCAACINALSGRRPAGREWLGLGLGFLGVMVLCLGKELRAAPGAMGLLLLAPIGWAFGSTWARRLALPKGLMAAGTQMLMGGLMAGVIAVVRQEPIPSEWPLRAVGALVYLTVFGSLVAFSAYTYLLENTRPAVAMSYAYVNPGLAVILGALLGGEPIQPAVVGASALIIAGVFLMAVPRRKLS